MKSQFLCTLAIVTNQSGHIEVTEKIAQQVQWD
jgi:hypothetical protein